MRKMNEVLPAIQDKFETALNRGQVLELNAPPGATADDILEAVLAEGR